MPRPPLCTCLFLRHNGRPSFVPPRSCHVDRSQGSGSVAFLLLPLCGTSPFVSGESAGPLLYVCPPPHVLALNPRLSFCVSPSSARSDPSARLRPQAAPPLPPFRRRHRSLGPRLPAPPISTASGALPSWFESSYFGPYSHVPAAMGPIRLPASSISTGALSADRVFTFWCYPPPRPRRGAPGGAGRAAAGLQRAPS